MVIDGDDPIGHALSAIQPKARTNNQEQNKTAKRFGERKGTAFTLESMLF